MLVTVQGQGVCVEVMFVVIYANPRALALSVQASS